jgi:hypothetical protein
MTGWRAGAPKGTIPVSASRMTAPARLALAAVSVACAGVVAVHAQVTPDTKTIIERSVAANQRNWVAAPNYDYVETDRDKGMSRTYRVTMILGTPYRRVIATNGRALSNPADRAEQRKYQQELAHRRSESSDEHAKRLKSYDAERERDRVLMSQIATAFDFTLERHEAVGVRDTFVLKATPRAGYKPPNAHAEALTGMRGQLWVDVRTYNWVKVAAEVFRPVSIEGFLARVEPGTSFELEEMPVDGGVWLPRHFRAQSTSRILGVFSHGTEDDETYSQYKKASQE